MSECLFIAYLACVPDTIQVNSTSYLPEGKNYWLRACENIVVAACFPKSDTGSNEEHFSTLFHRRVTQFMKGHVRDVRRFLLFSARFDGSRTYRISGMCFDDDSSDDEYSLFFFFLETWLGDTPLIEFGREVPAGTYSP